MNLFKKARHYLDPRTHIKAVRSAGQSVINVHKRVFDFHRRVVSPDNIKQVGRDVAKVEIKFMPYVTGVLAFIASIFFTPAAGVLLTGAGAGVATYQGRVAGRGQGKHGNEANKVGLRKRNQTLELGALGTTAGLLTSVGVAALSTPSLAAAAGAAGDAGAAGAAAGAGVGESAAIAAEYGLDYAATGAAAGQAAGEATAAGGGVLNGVWSVAKTALTAAQQILPTVLKFLTPAPKTGAIDGAGAGAAAGGAAGTGDVGTDGGGFMDTVAGLPLVVKLAAAAGGAGLVYVAFHKKGRAA